MPLDAGDARPSSRVAGSRRNLAHARLQSFDNSIAAFRDPARNRHVPDVRPNISQRIRLQRDQLRLAGNPSNERALDILQTHRAHPALRLRDHVRRLQFVQHFPRDFIDRKRVGNLRLDALVDLGAGAVVMKAGDVQIGSLTISGGKSHSCERPT